MGSAINSQITGLRSRNQKHAERIKVPVAERLLPTYKFS